LYNFVHEYILIKHNFFKLMVNEIFQNGLNGICCFTEKDKTAQVCKLVMTIFLLL
jgi:hypothetical protein